MSTRSKSTRGAATVTAATAETATTATAPAVGAAAAVPAAQAAQPRTAKSSRSKQAEAANTMNDVPVSIAPVAAAPAVTIGEWSLSAHLTSLGGVLPPLEERSCGTVGLSQTELAAQLRTLQQTIIRQANTRASDLLHPDLWPSFLSRLVRVQANTVRLDVHLLTAIGRTVAQAFSSAAAAATAAAEDSFASFTLFPTLQQLVELLLPCDSTPVASSWVSTFHPNYELLSAFVHGLLRQLLPQTQTGVATQTVAQVDGATLPSSVWQLLSSVLGALTLVNAAQNAQRKVFEQALQERNLPVWAAVHQALLRALSSPPSSGQSSSDQSRTAMRECVARIESLVAGALFHPEHLSLYNDALATVKTASAAGEATKDADSSESDDNDEADGDEAAKEAALAAAEAKRRFREENGLDEDEAEQEDADAKMAEEGEEDEEKESKAAAPASKKAKVGADGAAKASSTKDPKKKSAAKGAASAPNNNKPVPQNYVFKLFEAVQTWLGREDADAPAAQVAATATAARDAKGKKRKADADGEAAPAAPAASATTSIPHVSRAIRSALPLLFAGYVSASNNAFQALYPSVVGSALAGEGVDAGAAPVLTPLEQRRRRTKEKAKTERQMRFLQKVWQLNEHSPALQRLTAGAAGEDSAPNAALSFVKPMYSRPLSAESLPILHDMFACNARLFALVRSHDLYRIHQDANNSTSSTATSESVAGIKGILASQVHAVMAVARSLIVTANGAAVSAEKPSAEKEGKKSKKAVAASLVSGSSSATLSPSDLLSLSVPLASNLLHLLHLNPEFIVRYLYVRSTTTTASNSSSTAAANNKAAEVNIWHLVWAVYHLASAADIAPSTSTNSQLLSSPSRALRSVRGLSQAIFLSFSRQRQFEVLFASYALAARLWPALVGSASSSMAIVPFATVNGSRFDLALLLRSVPPLRVPTLWQWCLEACQSALSSSSSSPASVEALVQLFAFFLDSLMVREEIALQLDKLYKDTIAKLLREPIVKALTKGASSKQKANASDSSSLASLLLLLHSLNDVQAQVAQHTTRPYETMLEPLAGFFAPFGASEEESSSATSVDGSADDVAHARLTDVVSSLAAEAGRADPALLHALHLLSMQRLGQLHRFQSRNIVINRFADAMQDEEDQSNSDSDSDEDMVEADKKSNKKQGAVSLRPKQSHEQEAQLLTSFLLENLSTCSCFESASSAAHARFAWDGSVGSLRSNPSAASVALWRLLVGRADVLATFASQEQRQAFVHNMLRISACAHCHHASVAGGSAHSRSSGEGALHSLSSVTTTLLSSSWFFEVSSLRTALMDAAMDELIKAASTMHGAVAGAKEQKKTSKKASSASTSEHAVDVPAELVLTAAQKEQVQVLVAFAHTASSSAGVASNGASSSLSGSSLWSALWVLEVLHALPMQYLSQPQSFHRLLVQVLWSIETLASAVVGSSASAAQEGEPASLVTIAADVASAQVIDVLSHLLLAARRMLHASIASLVSSSAAPSVAVSASSSLASALPSIMLEWLFFSRATSRGGLRGRHQLLARRETRAIRHLLAPALLVPPKPAAKQTQAAGKDAAAASSETATSKKKANQSAEPTTAVVFASPLQSVLGRLVSSLSASPSGDDSKELLLSVQLAASLVDSLVPRWDVSPAAAAATAAGAPGTASTEFAKQFKQLVRDAPALFDLIGQLARALRKHLLPLILDGSTSSKSSKKVSKSKAATADAASSPSTTSAALRNGVLHWSARMLVVLFAFRSGLTDKERASAEQLAKVDDAWLRPNADALLRACLASLTSSSSASSASSSSCSGAITFVHALCVSLPLFRTSGDADADGLSSVSLPTLLDALLSVASADAQTRLNAVSSSPLVDSESAAAVSASSSSVSSRAQVAWASLMSHASPTENAALVSACLVQLDPSFVHAPPMIISEEDAGTTATAGPSASARMLAALELLHVFVLSMHSLAHRQALSSAQLSLLLYRLASLSGDWSAAYLSHTLAGTASVLLLREALCLVSGVLSRQQLFALDDASLALLMHLLTHTATLLRDGFARSERERLSAAATTTVSIRSSSSSSSLFHPYYLVLSGLLKSHPSALVKVVPTYLSLLRTALEAQWRAIQHAPAAGSSSGGSSGGGLGSDGPVPLSLSENVARLLEEFGRPSTAKLFNKYAVGLLVDWLSLSKHKGRAWGTGAQEAHLRALNRGLFAVIGLCDEHQLKQLHNLLDQQGKAAFRALHQAFKKTRFTGLT